MKVLTVFAFLWRVLQAWSVIIEVPENGTYSVGANILLKCVTREINKNIIWRDLGDDTIIFIGKGKFTEKEKYSNFQINPTPGDYSLTIIDACPTDRGAYSCQDGDEHRNAWITIKVLPLTLYINSTSIIDITNGHTLTVGDTIAVTCVAEDTEPNVSLELKYGSGDWIKPKPLKQHSNSSYLRTEIKDIHIVSLDDSQIFCRAIGTSEIPQLDLPMELMYKPRCEIKLLDNQIKCICDANPNVIQYKMFVNGEEKSSTQSVEASHYVPANFSCVAVNDIGVGESEARYVSKPAAVATKLVFVSGAVVCCLLVVSFILRKKDRRKILINLIFTSSDDDQAVITRPDTIGHHAEDINIEMDGTLGNNHATNDTYEKIYASVPMDKVILFNEMKMISQMKKSSDLERWLGMMKSVGKVVLSSPTESGSVTSRTDWGAYVKKLLDLSTVTHVVNVRGVCIEKGRLYLVQEYVPNGTLRSHLISLESKQNAENASILAFLELASNLLHGIDFIRRKEFYHPGLSSDKVLITTDNRCKMYDFCTADMVKDKIKCILEKQKNETICQVLPPEAVFHKAYDDGSEMWSLAVTLWEIFSYGKSPMLSFQLLQPENQIQVFHNLEKSGYLPTSIFQLLVQCWSVSLTSRPTVDKLITTVDNELSHCRACIEKNEMYSYTSGVYQDTIYVESDYEITCSGNIFTESKDNCFSETSYEVPALVSDESYVAMVSSTDDEVYTGMS